MGKKKPLIRRIRSTIIILIVFVIIIICCMYILRSILWNNTNEMGLSLVKNYSSAEEHSIGIYEVILNICTNYIAEREQEDISLEELREGLYPFMNGLTDLYGRDNVQIYAKALKDTQLVSNNPAIEAMGEYDITDMEWYQGAVAAEGEIYISTAYTDALTALPVVTMCKVVPETGSFAAIDLKPSCFEISNEDMTLPEKASYYLVDKEGRLLYYQSSWNYDMEGFQNLVDSYREDAVCEAANHVSENVMAVDGIVRNVYFHHMNNGWTGILTIPRDEILSGYDIVRNISIMLISFGIVLIILQALHEYRDGKREEEQKRMLAQAVARAEAASNAKSDFLSRMSHDIRTPMNAILGMTAVAAMHIDEKNRVLDALDKIMVSGRHLLGLINEVLDMSRIESGKVSLTEDSFNLSNTIESILTVFHSQMEAKELKLSASIAKLEHENVIGDEQHLQQIFMNIMGNAVKFTPKGGTISIHIEEKPSHISGRGYYEFIFEDTGIGMEPEYIKTIFEPFSRAANSSGSKIEGTGLGMSIAVNIARMMDGDIKVESTLGKGSKFTVMVHLKLDNVTQEDVDALAGLSILVVDDGEESCESACEILYSLGMKAEYVLDGDSAIKHIVEASEKGTEFAALMLDWKMPGKDGLEVTKEIRKGIGSHIPIIILSAYDWADIAAEATAAGVDAFISKPLFKSRLIRVLLNVLGHGSEEEKSNALKTFIQRDFSGKRVLLVEDNEINIEVAEELLNMAGIQVEKAMNGQLAVERVLEQPPYYYSLIFMDIQMPVMNGYEAAKAIRNADREDLLHIPIVAMTADAFLDDIKRAQEAGMNDHISKPVDVDKLEDALCRWIQ